mgnify:CR=1 FL=1
MIVLDRVEGARAVLVVQGERIEWPLCALPPGAREGDIFALVRDDGATKSQKEDAEARLARLRARGPQGPDTIDL